MISEIVLTDIEKFFSKRHILKGVNAKIKTGEVVGLLGPNGSGKTTLFYIVAGVLFPEHGSVVLNNEDITDFPMYKRARMGIGYLPQDASIFRGLTVEQNIDSALQIYYKDKDERRAQLDFLLEDFSITHLRNSMSVTLSGGERRRLEIARTLAVNPKFVLLDEPFAGVDPISVGDLRILIENLVKRDIGVLITDHNVLETLNIVNRSYILYDGQIIFEGTKEEVLSSSDVKKVYLGHSF